MDEQQSKRRMQYAGIFFHIDWISAEIWIFNFPRYCSNMPKVRWAMSYGFCSKFHTFQQCKNFENRLRCDKVTESLKVRTFLRHSVVLTDSGFNYFNWLLLNFVFVYAFCCLSVISTHFTAGRSYASAVLGVVILSVCPWYACFVTTQQCANNALRIF